MLVSSHYHCYLICCSQSPAKSRCSSSEVSSRFHQGHLSPVWRIPQHHESVPPARLGWPGWSANHPAAVPSALWCHATTTLTASLGPSYPPLIQSCLIPIVCKGGSVFSIPVSQVFPTLREYWEFRSHGLCWETLPFLQQLPKNSFKPI